MTDNGDLTGGTSFSLEWPLRPSSSRSAPALYGSSPQKPAAGAPRRRMSLVGTEGTFLSSDSSPESGRWYSNSRKQPVVTECNVPKAASWH